MRLLATRAWSGPYERGPKAAVEAVDAERIRYLRKLLEDGGIPSKVAETRARIMNWAYLGYALSSTRLDHESLKSVVSDLSQLARSRFPPFSDETGGTKPVARRRRRPAKP